VIPCKLCLEWETYEDGIAYGSADFAGSSWTGTVGGHSFVSYWEREILPDIIPPVSSNSIGMPFALIEAGTYTMGSPGSETGRDADETEVSTSVDEFVIGTTEVTQSQYLTVRGLSPSHFSGSGRPVEKVSYADALAFCAALSALPAEIAMGRSYRLPTEAEWEFACRAGTTTAYNFGANAADLPDNGWFTTNSGAETHDVGGKPANAKGLVDSHGNVWEWAQNSRMDGSAGEQVIRGGGWNSTAAECRSANRTLIAETTKRNDIGFRVVMVRSPIPQFGECEYIVTLDDEEVYRATCYEGASCRNPSGDVHVSTAYLEGTLRWSKFDPRELALIVDPDTGCRDFFCGDCRCSCDCLCVTIVEPDGNVIRGELCTACYPCDAPVWEGTLGYYDLSIALGRDEYTGECIITLTANGEEQDPVFVTGCADMSASVTLYDGTVISVVCKQCSCSAVSTACCPDRCNPMNYEECDNPLPLSLTCELTMTLAKPDPISGSATTCVNVSGELFLTPTRTYLGDLSGSCSGWCGGVTRTFNYTAELACTETIEDGFVWRLSVFDDNTGDANQRCNIGLDTTPTATMLNVSCDPIYFTGTLSTWNCSDWICVIPLLGIDEVFGEIVWDALVYENP
jgi:formylglycine-generating enzyme required for sulfatase activity